MHKKLANDLTSLAHSILRMKDKNDVFALKAIAHEVYEKLSLLAYVEEYINTTPNAEGNREELLASIEKSFEEKQVRSEVEEVPTSGVPETNDVPEVTSTEEPALDESTPEEIENENIAANDVVNEAPKATEILEQPFDELEQILAEEPKTTTTEPAEKKKMPTLDEELADTISVDVMANLFEKIEPKKTLHDKLQNTIQIDLNDRIAFVKHLFKGNQEDFNRIISQLNTIDSEAEAKKFINTRVKPDYDWSDKEEYEARLIEIIERKFIV